MSGSDVHRCSAGQRSKGGSRLKSGRVRNPQAMTANQTELDSNGWACDVGKAACGRWRLGVSHNEGWSFVLSAPMQCRAGKFYYLSSPPRQDKWNEGLPKIGGGFSRPAVHIFRDPGPFRSLYRSWHLRSILPNRQNAIECQRSNTREEQSHSLPSTSFMYTYDLRLATSINTMHPSQLRHLVRADAGCMNSNISMDSAWTGTADQIHVLQTHVLCF